MTGRGNPSSDRQVSDLTPPSMSAPRPSEADVEVVLTPDEVRRFERIEDSGDTQGLTWLVNQTVKSHLAARDAEHEREAMDRYWEGYASGRDEAETRDLNYDAMTDRAESAERALADRDAAIKAVREFCEEHQRQWNPGMEKAQQFTFDGGVGAAAQDVLALLPRDDAAGAGGAE